MSTFLDLQDLVLDWLDDPNAGYFTRAKVKQWINFGQKEVQKLLLRAGENWYATCQQTTTVANQADYALPQNFLKVTRIVLVDNAGTSQEYEDPIDPITPGQINLVAQSAQRPSTFWLKKNRLVLAPKPDRAYTLRLYYAYRVADMVEDAETPDIPEQYHELAAILGAENGFLKDGRDASLLVARKRGYQELLSQDAENRVESEPRYVVTTDE